MSDPYRTTPAGQHANPAYVRVVDVRLTWRNVFVLIFKFTIAFLVIDAVFVAATAVIIATVLNS